MLKGCVEGDGNCFQDDDGIPGKDNAVDAGDGTVEMSQLLTLPAGKTCSYCVLQWMWAARQDGGFYIGMFKDNMPNGKGKNVYANGVIEEGLFKDGKFML